MDALGAKRGRVKSADENVAWCAVRSGHHIKWALAQHGPESTVQQRGPDGLGIGVCGVQALVLDAALPFGEDVNAQDAALLAAHRFLNVTRYGADEFDLRVLLVGKQHFSRLHLRSCLRRHAGNETVEVGGVNGESGLKEAGSWDAPWTPPLSRMSKPLRIVTGEGMSLFTCWICAAKVLPRVPSAPMGMPGPQSVVHNSRCRGMRRVLLVRDTVSFSPRSVGAVLPGLSRFWMGATGRPHRLHRPAHRFREAAS